MSQLNLIEVKGKKLFFYMIKSSNKRAKTIVLLHGLLWTSKIWLAFINLLNDKYNIIVPDMPGHGNSTKLFEYNHASVATEIYNFTNEIDLNDFILIGSSWGASIAVKFTSMFPKKVSHLVLLDGGYYKLSSLPGIEREIIEEAFYTETSMSSMEAYVSFVKESDPSLWNPKIEEAVRDQVTELPNKKVAHKLCREDELKILNEEWDFDPLLLLRQIDTRLTLIIAENDNDTKEIKNYKAHCINEIKNSHYNTKIIYMKDTDHLIMLHRPQQLKEILEDLFI